MIPPIAPKFGWRIFQLSTRFSFWEFPLRERRITRTLMQS
jgi:hypothetical protein